MLLLEQNTIKKEKKDKKMTELEFEDKNSKEYKVLVSNPTWFLICAGKYLYFSYSLGNLLVTSLLVCNSGACTAWPGLVTEKEEPLKTLLIYITDI